MNPAGIVNAERLSSSKGCHWLRQCDQRTTLARRFSHGPHQLAVDVSGTTIRLRDAFDMSSRSRL